MEKYSAQKGIASIILLILLLAGIVTGAYLVTQKTNLKPKASSRFSVEFIKGDKNNFQAIQATSSAKVKLKLNAPAENEDLVEASSRFNSIDGNIVEPDATDRIKNAIVVSGTVSNPEKKRFEGNYSIEYCDPDGDGVTNFAPISYLGTFRFTVKKGQIYCLKPPKIPNYLFPPDPALFQYQIAGMDCANKEKNKKACRVDLKTRQYDLEKDSGFNFTYKKITPESGCNLDSDCKAGEACVTLYGDPEECVGDSKYSKCQPVTYKTCQPKNSVPSSTPTITIPRVKISEDFAFPDDKTTTLEYLTEGEDQFMVAEYAFALNSSGRIDPGVKKIYIQFVTASGKIINADPYPAEINYQMAEDTTTTTPSSGLNTKQTN